jgi:hypothetical protein
MLRQLSEEVNSTIDPNDFISNLPPELSVHIFSFLANEILMYVRL